MNYNDYGIPAHTLIKVAFITQRALAKCVNKKNELAKFLNKKFLFGGGVGKGRGTFAHWRLMQTLIKNQSPIYLYFMQLPSSKHTKKKFYVFCRIN
jgi:hypothetical protein